MEDRQHQPDEVHSVRRTGEPPWAAGLLPPLSVLDLALTEEGASARDALAAVVSTARRASELGFRRVWVAEHHRYRSVGSVAPAVLSSHLAASTSGVRVGSGGVLLTNHAPLAVAEQFTTLAALHPGRIDLGIGRGPGTNDLHTIRALRRGADRATDDEYRAGLIELLEYLADADARRVLPGADALPEPWLLSSSVGGSELAAELGLPLAFAHHIRPDNTLEALGRYREQFRASRWCERPRVLVSVETLCAPTHTEVDRLGRPAMLAMAAAVEGRGAEAPLLSPAKAATETLNPALEERLGRMRAAQAYGTPEEVRRRLSAVASQTGADELMLSTPVYDLNDRMRSVSLVAAVNV
ncbi:LLM class flavin-dependent oxidoreductase [Streptomyces gibsoniae]|uniref:LLM class flavin-dependent oxidoreductase n=1 Tax=Streptomyces gibsoniae TaxID=3075529 RepID=A0ABU2U9D9_9ACTN|nr:LLM class flavin-dependent oxidoreductase [Streptomyces sp. DSM 41699]MDT0469853.1 LLM class flavin-dependent oxidoreductase [Streptomyces sp. DSM 41699]